MTINSTVSTVMVIDYQQKRRQQQMIFGLHLKSKVLASALYFVELLTLPNRRQKYIYGMQACSVDGMANCRESLLQKCKTFKDLLLGFTRTSSNDIEIFATAIAFFDRKLFTHISPLHSS